MKSVITNGRVGEGGRLEAAAHRSGVRPPTLIGGSSTPVVKSVHRIDWISVTYKMDVEFVKVLGAEVLGVDSRDWIPLEHGSQGYESGFVNVGAAKLWYGGKTQNGSVHLSLPGKACGFASEHSMRHFINRTADVKGNPTRLDLAIDDMDKSIKVIEVDAAINSPSCITRAVDTVYMRSHKVGGFGLKGESVYIGSKASPQLMRIYDKDFESKGEIKSIRWEMVCREGAAESIFVELWMLDDWHEVFRNRMRSFVDFREVLDYRTHSTSRRKRLPWYEAIMGDGERGAMYAKAKQLTIEEKDEWLQSSVFPTLALVETAKGGDLSYLEEGMREGRKRWKPHHKQMLAEHYAKLKQEAS